jgi:hypothetical protein
MSDSGESPLSPIPTVNDSDDPIEDEDDTSLSGFIVDDSVPSMFRFPLLSLRL